MPQRQASKHSLWKKQERLLQKGLLRLRGKRNEQPGETNPKTPSKKQKIVLAHRLFAKKGKINKRHRIPHKTKG
jgi:hypothetical protein